ncbi:WD-40 repeat-containing protein [Reticulomyxa filosa]|uniref:WD-40 repeat-containing protein n=1 Tax=Reticulomyxa filosa TaxID=46433 RepID=X6MR38_RETFI|nr:WD-40 repeat-containing protein [Reticulomyxa filosa]|eukprot:ETO15570.1 WD-40 repeat-containing protein [Reticulomyxa filosa]
MINVMNLKKWKVSHSSYDIGYEHYKLHLFIFFSFFFKYKSKYKIIIIQYTMSIFNIFCASKLLNTLTGHTGALQNIDYKTFNDRQLICSGSCDITVRVCDVDNNKQIQLFDECPTLVNCVKFSSYNNNNKNIICISSNDNNIRFCDFEHNNQLKKLYVHKYRVNGIEFSSFNGGRYLCSGSLDNTVGIWDIETYKSLNFFKGHKNAIYCVDISPVHINNNNNTGIIGGNGYTVCSSSSIKPLEYGILKQSNN